MTRDEINTLEHASRGALAWAPEGIDRHPNTAAIVAAMLSAFGILAAAAAVLFVAV